MSLNLPKVNSQPAADTQGATQKTVSLEKSPGASDSLTALYSPEPQGSLSAPQPSQGRGPPEAKVEVSSRLDESSEPEQSPQTLGSPKAQNSPGLPTVQPADKEAISGAVVCNTEDPTKPSEASSFDARVQKGGPSEGGASASRERKRSESPGLIHPVDIPNESDFLKGRDVWRNSLTEGRFRPLPGPSRDSQPTKKSKHNPQRLEYDHQRAKPLTANDFASERSYKQKGPAAPKSDQKDQQLWPCWVEFTRSDLRNGQPVFAYDFHAPNTTPYNL